MKKIIFCLLLFSVQHVVTAQVKKTVPLKTAANAGKITLKNASTNPQKKIQPPKIILKSALDSFSYAAGVSIGGSMQQQGIESVSTDILSKAVEDVLKGNTLLLTKDQVTMTLQQKLQEYSKKKNEAQKSKGEAFLSENKKRKGVTTLPNGLQYEVLKSGEAGGIKPAPVDTVVVDYVGTLIDGSEFDNSIKRGEPAEFPLNGVIKGWTEILQLMTKGDKWKVYIPSELGYGERGAGGSIPPNSTLIFEINLINIKPAAK